MWFISGLEKSPLGANKSTIRTFLPDQNATFIGQNVLLVLTFIYFEPHRGSRGVPLAFSDCLMYFFHFRFSGVATSKPSLELFSGPKNRKTLNDHISKSLLAPKGLFSKPLQKLCECVLRFMNAFLAQLC